MTQKNKHYFPWCTDLVAMRSRTAVWVEPLVNMKLLGRFCNPYAELSFHVRYGQNPIQHQPYCSARSPLITMILAIRRKKSDQTDCLILQSLRTARNWTVRDVWITKKRNARLGRRLLVAGRLRMRPIGIGWFHLAARNQGSITFFDNYFSFLKNYDIELCRSAMAGRAKIVMRKWLAILKAVRTFAAEVLFLTDNTCWRRLTVSMHNQRWQKWPSGSSKTWRSCTVRQIWQMLTLLR